MTLTRDALLRRMRDGARAVPFDETHTWADALFTAEGELSRPDEPDRAMLRALADELVEADAHADLAPQRLRLEWLEDVLLLERQPTVPDRVVAHATVDPALAPVVIPAGTELRGGKDVYGTERRYRTADALTAHGAALTSVLTQVHRTDPGVVGQAGDYPLNPQLGADAAHEVRFTSEVLRFAGGDLEVDVVFTGAPSPLPLTGMVWRYPLPDGTVGESGGAVNGNTVTVTMHDGCGVPGEPAWIELAVPEDRPVPTTMRFSTVTLAVTKRTSVAPDAAYANDGLLDVTKEFTPFGPVATRGDAWYIRSDEAFGKPLATVAVSMSVLSDGTVSTYAQSDIFAGLTNAHAFFTREDGTVVRVEGAGVGGSTPDTYEALSTTEAIVAEDGASEGIVYRADPTVARAAGVTDGDVTDTGFVSVALEARALLELMSRGFVQHPSLRWELLRGNGWDDFADATALRSLAETTTPGSSTEPASRPTTVGGEQGHFLRLFLRDGDFGWSKHLEQLAAFGTAAAKNAVGNRSIPVPPTPPIVSSVTLSYTTLAVPPDQITSRNGWLRHTKAGTSPWSPFSTTVATTGETGMIAIGVAAPATAAHSSVSIYLGIDPMAQCGTSGDPDAHWEWWDGDAWQRLLVDDGTRSARESGLVRFIAPGEWAQGCARLGMDSGRWIRLVTTAPERLGTLRHVAPDAVVAHYVSASDPTTDPTPEIPLAPGDIKGTVRKIAGVKKVTNVEGIAGRGPESDASFAARASTVTRHRRRARTPWDYEQHVSVEFPEVGAVRCLPHTNPAGARARGQVGLVVVPQTMSEPSPRPSVRLTGQILTQLEPLTPLHASAHVMCAQFAPVTVEVELDLRRGIASLSGRTAVATALEAYLHPLGTTPTRWGRSLYRSSLEAFVESLAVVDAIVTLRMRNAAGAFVESVDVDPCRGLYCSSGAHAITAREAL